MGYEVLMVEDDSLRQIEQSIRTIGKRMGRAPQADAIIAGIEANVHNVRRRVQPFPVRPRADAGGPSANRRGGPGTYLDDLMKIARADNIADAASQQWPRLSLEYIIAMRPEVILDGQMGSDPHSPTQFWDEYPTIPAVRNHRVVGYPEDPTLHPGPRIGTTLEMLARLIHPEACENSAMNAAVANALSAIARERTSLAVA